MSKTFKEMNGVYILDHPLIQHKLALLRDKNTHSKDFRELLSEVAMLMAYEVTRDLPLRPVEIETPMGMAHCHMLEGRNIALVPILRAGLGMVAGMTNLIPMAKIGHIGLYRDPVTLEPVEYYCKLPEDVQQRDVILLDPMLATGGSAAAAVDFLKMREIKDIKFVCLVAAPEGIKHFHGAHPEIPIYCAALDDGLDDHAYILPGLGDAGDRLFGTK